ncbi:H-2 class II histocompatibility antigen, A-Q alpha chain-like [Gastrophryne carolinensis]
MIVLCVSALLLLTGVKSVEVDYFDFPATVVQTQKPTGEYLMDYGDNELFHVDLDSKKVAWTLSDLEKLTSYDVQHALQNINIMKYNLNIYMKRSKNTTATSMDYFDFPATVVQTQKPTGEYLMDYGDNELFHVDLDSKKVAWTLSDLEKLTSYDVQHALQNINIMKYNLNIYMKRSKNTTATSITPEGKVYTSHPVIFGEPNVLICFVRNIFPPVMNVTWLKNGQKIYDGVTETIFLPSQDHSFRKFLYLAFIPTMSDFYSCEMEHWGLDGAKRMPWEPDAPSTQPETAETLICAFGLFIGFIGIVAGVILIIKGMRLNTQQRRRGNLSTFFEPEPTTKTCFFCSLSLSASGTESLSFTTTL